MFFWDFGTYFTLQISSQILKYFIYSRFVGCFWIILCGITRCKAENSCWGCTLHETSIVHHSTWKMLVKDQTSFLLGLDFVRMAQICFDCYPNETTFFWNILVPPNRWFQSQPEQFQLLGLFVFLIGVCIGICTQDDARRTEIAEVGSVILDWRRSQPKLWTWFLFSKDHFLRI